MHRLLLAVCVVACTCLRVAYTDATSQIRLKDIICVLVLSGVQKDDLDSQTISKLNEHNVNVSSVFNDEQVKQDCYLHHLQKAVNISHRVYMNHSIIASSTTQQASLNNTTASPEKNPKSKDVLYKIFVTSNITNLDSSQKPKANITEKNRRTNRLTKRKNVTVRSDRPTRLGFKLQNSNFTNFFKRHASKTSIKIYETTTVTKPIVTTVKVENNLSAANESYEEMNILESLKNYDDISEDQQAAAEDPPIADLDGYIKDVVAKYLSETGVTKGDTNIKVSTTGAPRLVAELKFSTIKEVNAEENTSKRPVVIDANSITKLTESIKDLVLSHIRQELQSSMKPDPSRRISETSTNIPEIETTTLIEVEKPTIDVTKHVENIEKLLQLIENISNKTATVIQPLPHHAPAHYHYKNEYNPYQNKQDHHFEHPPAYAINPVFNGIKPVYTISKVPAHVPQLSYASNYQYPQQTQVQLPTHEAQAATDQWQNLPNIVLSPVSDTNFLTDTVHVPYPIDPQYQNNKEHPQASPLYVLEEKPRERVHLAPQNTQEKVHELQQPLAQQSQQLHVKRMQYQPRNFVTLKPHIVYSAPPQPQSYMLPINQPTYDFVKPQFQQPQLYDAPAQELLNVPQTYEYSNPQHHVQYSTATHLGHGPPRPDKRFWLPPVVSYDKVHEIKQPVVTKIQTNIAEIPPLRIISPAHPVYQNIIVPKKFTQEKPKKIVRPPLQADSKVPIDSTEQWSRIKNQMQMNIEQLEPYQESLTPRLDDIWRYNKEHYGNAARYHAQLEREHEPQPAEHTRVASRQQRPYSHNHIFADTHIEKLMQSQQRISDILEHVLSLNKMLDNASTQFLNN